MMPFSTQILRSKFWRLFSVDFSLSLPSLTRHMHSGLNPCQVVVVVVVLVTQLCLTLSDPMDCSPPGSSVHLDSPDKNTGVGCHALLQRIFPIQGLNPGLLRCRQILHHLNHREALYRRMAVIKLKIAEISSLGSKYWMK